MTKAEKAAKTAELKKIQAAKKVRSNLLKTIASAFEERDTEELLVVKETSRCTSLRAETQVKETVHVLWKNQRIKFNMSKMDSMQPVFDKLAVEMDADPDKVLIFCNLGEDSRSNS